MSSPSAAADTTIEVIARIRPPRSGAASVVSVEADGQTLLVSGDARFAFSAAAGPSATQEALFELAGRRASDAALAGYNVTLFAYGQTGSGKTHTIYGPAAAPDGRPSAERGLLPRTLEYVFAQVRAVEAASGGKIKFAVKASFLEVRVREGSAGGGRLFFCRGRQGAVAASASAVIHTNAHTRPPHPALPAPPRAPPPDLQ